MSVFDHMAWAKRQRTGSVGAKAVLMALAERTGEKPTCYPSQVLLADETEQSERTVRTHLRTLEELGLIRSSRSYVDEDGNPLPRGRARNKYELLVGDQPAKSAGGQRADQPATRGRPTGNSGPTNRQAVAGEEPVVEEPVEEHPPDPRGQLDLGDPTASAAPTGFDQQLVAVFDEWRTVTGHPKAQLDNNRKRRIAAALRSHGFDTTMAAVRGVQWSPFHLGQNDSGQRYDDVTLILRDAAHLERFAEYEQDPTTRPRADTSARDPFAVGSPPTGPTGSVPTAESTNPAVIAERRR